jgi:hypothetical protein
MTEQCRHECAPRPRLPKQFTSVLLVMWLSAGPNAIGQTPPSAPKPAPASPSKVAPTAVVTTDVGWPRMYSDGAATVAIHQPQVDDWKDFKVISARSAVEIVPREGCEETAGGYALGSANGHQSRESNCPSRGHTHHELPRPQSDRRAEQGVGSSGQPAIAEAAGCYRA